MPKSRFILPLVLGCAASNALAEDWDLCPPMPALPEPRLEAGDDPEATDAVADEITSSGSTHILTGNVEVMKGRYRVGADRIEIDRAGGFAQAEGNVYLRSEEAAIFSPRGEIDIDTGAFDMEQPRLLYPPMHGQGGARRAVRDDLGVATLTDGTWSTCPEGNEDWNLDAGEIELDPNNRQGTARHTSLWFQGVPLLYTPWFRFPLGDERLSGFLAPSLGSSGDSGTTVTVPWYWNIAPDRDATITPHYMSKRGFQLQLETRWLGPTGEWALNLHHLPDDSEFGDDRTLGQLIQEGRFDHGLRTDIDVASVSDDEYFEDMGDELSVTSKDYLESRADVHWNNDYGKSRLRLQSFSTLDDTIQPGNRPYKQLPQITHRYRDNRPGRSLVFDGELVAFERDDSDTATRLRLVPALTREWETPGWFVRPRLALDHTSYSIDRATSTGPATIDRTLPIMSLDTGLIFERFGDRFYQTLEPRAFYVHIPDEEQDDIPIFDTGSRSFSFNRLFQERRFSGGDRIGDTNRLALALTSRLLDTGYEILRGSIGVTRHFDDRDVTLPNRSAETDNQSDYFGELAVRPSTHWRGSISAQWDPDTEKTQQHNSRLTYQGPGGGLANLAYRYRRDRREQTDLSFAWPITPRWSLMARNNYSLLDEQRIESLIGLEYEDCCWRLRTVAREHIEQNNNNEIRDDYSIYIELVLKGLGGIGDPAGRTFENAILGYEDPSD